MSEADYPEISQQYAQGAIKAAILMNGGAAAAVLSQMAELSKLLPPQSIGSSVLWFIFGAVIGASCWVAGFISTRHVDRKNRGKNSDHSADNRWMFAGMVLLIVSILAFAIGASLLAYAFINSQP